MECMGEKFRVVVGKAETWREKTLRTHRLRWEDNIKTDLKRDGNP
jgi:hypothetical protein